MPPLPTSMLAERLERLEREDRRRKRMRVPALVGLIALAAGGAKLADPPKLVEAERIVLRDKTGKMRARLAVGRDGAPNLEFFDGEEKGSELFSLLPDRRGTRNGDIVQHDRIALRPSPLQSFRDPTPPISDSVR